MAAPDGVFRADPAERLLQPEMTGKGRGRYVALSAALLLYALLLGALLLEDFLRRDAPVAVQEIPIEVVVEPPEQKPPDPPQPQPQPTAKPLDEEPAFDAPRLANNDKQETETRDDSAKSPPAPEAEKPPSPKPEPSQAQEASKESAPQPQPEPAAAPESAADSSSQGELSPEKPINAEQHAEAETQPDARAATDAARAPTFASVPDIDFGAFAKPAPIAGGKAKATYLSIIYGMVMSRVHFPQNATRPPGGGKVEGTIVFTVDAMGGLIQRTIVHPSGSHALDVAAYEAIGRAAPFPKPPTRGPIGLRFTYGAN